MKALVFHGVGDIRLEEVPEPKLQAPTDAIVRLTASAICGTDLHMVRGTMAMMKPGTILGHEGVGIVEDLGPDVRNFSFGDRVVIVSTDEAILLSDIFPTGSFGAELAEITNGDTVAVFGCGPVGQFTILSAKMLGAGRVLAVDSIPSRLEMARAQVAEVIDFNAEHPVEAIRRRTGGIGVDRAIDAVGVDAGPAAEWSCRSRGRRAGGAVRRGGQGDRPAGQP
jgi:threonine dehydrogenase-like Zn-dependent dehydrogenase